MGALKVQDEKKGIKIKIMGTYRDPTKMDQNTPSSNPLNSRIHHHHHNKDTIEISEHLLMNIVSVTGVVLENNTNCSSVHVGDSCLFTLLKILDFQNIHPWRSQLRLVDFKKLLRAYEMQEYFPDVQVIQWNDDAYEEILIDRTHEAVKGPADVVVNCQTNIRHLNRLFKVCKTDGDIIVGSSLSAFAQKKIFKESRKIVYCNQTENEMDPENVYLQSERICDLVSNMKLESSRVI
ncbi:unnamed protein product [Lepeophtheirus salmonis]|uniref:(salmon louse) hypothetical protein n=1 Tax=Lepeophtheirus salmonis TaxID=72036 RepID=A0A7R8CH76_LEPSM|nr:unnamed protein product [Lepeophtheirus salmonis]CAF2822328.1 unnamed protein product [Lepeophtheirus salmonis]